MGVSEGGGRGRERRMWWKSEHSDEEALSHHACTVPCRTSTARTWTGWREWAGRPRAAWTSPRPRRLETCSVTSVPSVCLFVCSSICPSLSVCLSVYLSGWLFLCLFVCLSVCLSVLLSVSSGSAERFWDTNGQETLNQPLPVFTQRSQQQTDLVCVRLSFADQVPAEGGPHPVHSGSGWHHHQTRAEEPGAPEQRKAMVTFHLSLRQQGALLSVLSDTSGRLLFFLQPKSNDLICYFMWAVYVNVRKMLS